MPSPAAPTPNRLLGLMPAVYREDPDGFLGDLLGAFEAVLLGGVGKADAPAERGLEEVIAGIAAAFDPATAPGEFLPWLAEWVAFGLRAELEDDKLRGFLGNVISLYPGRGTKANLGRLLKLFSLGAGDPVIRDVLPAARLGVHSTLDKDFHVEGGAPFSFEVTIFLGKLTAGELERQVQIARALIEMEKPAHTRYTLIPVLPGFQLGSSRLGQDPLGTPVTT